MKRAATCAVVSQPILGGVILSCVVLAAWFIPSSDELLHRLDRDGQTARVQQLARERLKAKSVSIPQTDPEKLAGWLDSNDHSVRDDAAVRAAQRSLCALTDAPLELGAVLFAHTKGMDADLADNLADALVNRALGLGRPADAASILRDWFVLRPSWQTTLREIQAWRWAERPGEALKALDAATAANVDPPEQRRATGDLRVKLALESNQPNLAFDIVMQRHAAAPAEERPAILIQLVELANLGDRTMEASRLLAEHLQSVPFHTCNLDKAIAMASNHSAFASDSARSEYKSYASAMARWQEWAGHGEIAYDTWLRLALLGDDEAWGRVLELKEDLLREGEFALVLDHEIANGRHLEFEPALADILLDDGRTDEAVRHYEAAAQRGTEALRVRKQLGLMYQEDGDWKRSLDEFEKALSISSSDLDAQKGRAFALVRLRRHEEACQAWIAIARRATTDPDVQESCAAICDSLGYHRECAEANKRLLACPGRVSTPDEHLDLAAQCHQIGDDAGEVAALREGLARFPASKDVRVSLAESLSARKGGHDEVMRLLADATVSDDLAAIALLIDEAADCKEPPAGIALFSGDVPACLQNQPELQTRLALLLDKWGRAEQAERITSALQKDGRHRNTRAWQKIARLCLDAGDVLRAEAFATLHLASTGAQDGGTWELLGDIYTSEGRKNEADQAYEKAMQALTPSHLAADLTQSARAAIIQH